MAGKSFPDFLKQNAGANAGFAALGVAADVASGDVGLKTILKTIRDLTIGTALWEATMVTAFGGMKRAVGGLVGEYTGFSSAMRKAREEYEKAQVKMAKGIAAPFEREEVENVKRMTKAMQGLTPVVNDLAKTYHLIYGGASGVKSEFAKFIGTTAIGRGAVRAFGTALAAVVPIISGFSVIKLGGWMSGLGNSMKSMAGASRVFGNGLEFLSMGLIKSDKASRVAFAGLNAVKGALKWSGVAAGVAIVAELGVMWINYRNSVKAAKLEAATFTADSARSSNILRAEINGISTATDKYTAMANAMDAVTEARKQWHEAIEGGNKEKIAAASANLSGKERLVAEAQRAPIGPDRSSTIMQRDIDEQQRGLDFERKLSQATPEQRKVLLAGEASRTAILALKGQADVDAQSASATAIGDVDTTNLQNRKERDISEEEIARQFNIPEDRRDKGIEKYHRDRVENAGNALVSGAKVKYNLMAESGSETLEAQAEFDKIRAARSYKEAAARVVPQDSTSGGEKRQKELDMKMGRAVGGYYTHESNETLLKMEGAAKTRLELAQKTAGNVLSNREQSQSRANQRTDEDMENKIATMRMETESKIAAIRDRGYTLADKEHALQMQLLKQEEDMEKSRPGGSRALALSDIANRRANLQTGQRNALEARATDRLDTNSELARQNMQLSGDARGIQGLDNSERYRKRYQEEFAKSGDAFDAGAKATRFSNNSISLGARHGADASDSAIKGDSLTRIFGGGNVAAGTVSSAVDIARQQKSAIEEGNKFLKIIADAVGAGDGDTLP